MSVHKNDRLAVHSRAVLVRRVLSEGQTPLAGPRPAGVGPPT